MNSTFDKAFSITVGIEGGYVDDEDDGGGETKYGISSKSYPKLDIKNLTLAQAKKIYYKDYYEGLNTLPPKIAIEVFDTGVNMGAITARKMLQEALNLLSRNFGYFAPLATDGIIGTNTLLAVKKVKVKILLKVLNGLQFCAYKEIVKERPKQDKFFAGWMKRV